MIKTVSFEKTTFNDLPYKFEAGTPDYVASTGLAKALDYLSAIGMDKIEEHERELTHYAIEKMQKIEGMHIFGPLGEHINEHDAVISFEVKPLGASKDTPYIHHLDILGASKDTPYIHHLDMGTRLDRLGIAVRTGHHCAEPLMRRLGVEGTCRASFGLYNTKEEVDALVAGIKRIQSMF